MLFGSVAPAGIRTPSRMTFTNSNLLIVAASIGVGIIPITVPEVYSRIPEWLATIFESGISTTAIFAVLLNLAFNHFSKTDEPVAPSTDGRRRLEGTENGFRCGGCTESHFRLRRGRPRTMPA